jgi:hypothetical protein
MKYLSKYDKTFSQRKIVQLDITFQKHRMTIFQNNIGFWSEYYDIDIRNRGYVNLIDNYTHLVLKDNKKLWKKYFTLGKK